MAAGLGVAVALCLLSVAFAYNNGAANSLLPPLGWSSWVALGPGSDHPIFDYCDEFSVKASVDAFIEVGLYDAGYRHFHLDDCWAGGRNASGYLYAEVDHFPNGMAPVIEYAHSKGLTFGLYTCGGTYTCVGQRPGSKDHWQQDADVWAEWGVDWVKMDWCNTQGMDVKTSYKSMSTALNASGRHIHFNMCEWGLETPWEWGNGVAQSWRMSGDHTGNWLSTKSGIAQSAAIPPQYTGVPWGWNDMDMLETGCRGQCAHANNKAQNMSDIEYKTEFSMWAISASPLLFTAPIMNCSVAPPPTHKCDISLVEQLSKEACVAGQTYGCYDNGTMWTLGCRGTFSCDGSNVTCNINGSGTHLCDCGPIVCKGWLSDLQKEILLNKEVLAINQDVTPQGTPLKAGDLTVWARHLSDSSVAIAFYNEKDITIDISPVQFAALGWPAGTTASVRDLWGHSDAGVFKDQFPATGTVSTQPHQTHLFRLTKQS